jgi:O-antigen/teichoic acid export membrane protein
LHKLYQRLLNNEIIRRVVKNSSYLFSATGIAAALGVLQGILTARLLGVAGYGVLGAVTTFVSVINNFVSFRMGELVVQYVGNFTENHDEIRAAAIFKTAAILEVLASLFSFGLVWLLAPWAAQHLAKDPAAQPYFVIYGLVLLANLISESSTGLLQISNRFGGLAVYQIAASVATLALIGLAYFGGGGMLAVLIAYVAGKTVGALGLSFTAIKQANQRWGSNWWRAPIAPLKPRARELAHFAVSTNLSASLSLVNKDSELLWVSYFRSPVEAGYYKLALALANLAQLPVSPLPQTTYPELAREAARRNWGNVRTILQQGSRLAGAYSLAATIGLVALGPLLIRWLYGAEYLPAYPALVILLLGLLVANTFYWRRGALLALERPDLPTKVNLVLAVLKIAGILLLVPLYGYLANAALLSLFYIASSAILVFYTYKLLRLRESEAKAVV